MNYLLLAIVAIWITLTLIRKSPIVVTIPKFWYDGITLGWLVIIRRESYNYNIVAHELIHFKQQRECLIFPAYIIYILEFIVKSIYWRSFSKGYATISFEQEARIFAATPDYVLHNRKPYNWRHFIMLQPILKLNKDMPIDKFNKVYELQRGQVFKFEGQYATIYNRINSNVPAGQKFAVKSVNSGSSLFTLYGANTMIVTKNEVTQTAR